MSASDQALCFMAGANSIFSSEEKIMLTKAVPCADYDADHYLSKKLSGNFALLPRARYQESWLRIAGDFLRSGFRDEHPLPVATRRFVMEVGLERMLNAADWHTRVRREKDEMIARLQEELASTGRITHQRALAWAKLFNLRYRMLLARFSHFMRLDQARYLADPGTHRGDQTIRGLLLILTFDEMWRLAEIANRLVQLPRDDPPGQLHAGPPFELPYTLSLPDEEPQRWRTHLDISRAAVRLIRSQLQDQLGEQDEFLDDLVNLDKDAQIVMQALAQGREIPADSLPGGFQKVVQILEAAIGGFTLGCNPHPTPFQAGKTRDELVAARARPQVVNRNFRPEPQWGAGDAPTRGQGIS